MSNIDKTLLSGSMGTMLLKLLSEKDMYGYEMIETLRSRSQNVFELKATARLWLNIVKRTVFGIIRGFIHCRKNPLCIAVS